MLDDPFSQHYPEKDLEDGHISQKNATNKNKTTVLAKSSKWINGDREKRKLKKAAKLRREEMITRRDKWHEDTSVLSKS